VSFGTYGELNVRQQVVIGQPAESGGSRGSHQTGIASSARFPPDGKLCVRAREFVWRRMQSEDVAAPAERRGRQREKNYLRVIFFG
jgi:hypothetical protein